MSCFREVCTSSVQGCPHRGLACCDCFMLCTLQDHVLLPLMMEEEKEKKGDPLLVVHPNYVVET